MSAPKKRPLARRRLQREARIFADARDRYDTRVGTLWKEDELRAAEEALDEAALAYAKSLGWRAPKRVDA